MGYQNSEITGMTADGGYLGTTGKISAGVDICIEGGNCLSAPKATYS